MWGFVFGRTKEEIKNEICELKRLRGAIGILHPKDDEHITGALKKLHRELEGAEK